jgi:hypothetical protein
VPTFQDVKLGIVLHQASVVQQLQSPMSGGSIDEQQWNKDLDLVNELLNESEMHYDTIMASEKEASSKGKTAAALEIAEIGRQVKEHIRKARWLATRLETILGSLRKHATTLNTIGHSNAASKRQRNAQGNDDLYDRCEKRIRAVKQELEIGDSTAGSGGGGKGRGV